MCVGLLAMTNGDVYIHIQKIDKEYRVLVIICNVPKYDQHYIFFFFSFFLLHFFSFFLLNPNNASLPPSSQQLAPPMAVG